MKIKILVTGFAAFLFSFSLNAQSNSVSASTSTTSYSVSNIPYSPFPYTTGTTVLANIDDTWSSPVSIGFNFGFYGTNYNQCLIGSNEVISFNTANAGSYNTWPISAPIPSSTPTDLLNCIMAPWQDIDPSVGGTILYNVIGNAPYRAFIVSFDSIPYFSCNSIYATSQIVLYETTNIIDIFIKDKDTCITWNNGLAIEGIQDANGTLATVVPGRNYPTQWSAHNDAKRFAPSGNSCTTTTATLDTIVNGTACGLNDGSISISVSTTAPPLSYYWANGSTTQNITGLAPGFYSVTINDAAGCSINLYATVGSPSNLTVSDTLTIPVSCSGGNNGAFYISVTGGNAPFTYNWSNGATTQNITSVPYGSYTLTVTDSNGCSAMAFLSDEDSSNIPTPSICMVTVDSLSQYNVIMWDKTSFSGIDSFIVYREIATNNYQPIGAVPFNALSQFVDTVRTQYFPNTGDPNAGTYRYKLQMRDSCGNYSSLSPYHNSIFMTNNNGNFSWTQLYTIEYGSNPVNAYVLMRDDNNNGNWHAINSVSGTQQTVSDPAYSTWQSTANWRVQTMWNITCVPSRITPNSFSSFNASKSNTMKFNPSPVNEFSLNNLISISPNPADGVLYVRMNLPPDDGVQIKIFNVYGELIHQQNAKSSNQQIDLTAQPSGIYFLHLQTTQGIAVKKIVIDH